MEKFKNKALAELISSMAKMDQLERSRVRQKQKLYSGLAKSDMARLRQMKRIVNKYGWTTRKLVGKRASHSAWLLVQHGDDDVKFQEYCLKLIKQAGENDEVANLPRLDDRRKTMGLGSFDEYKIKIEKEWKNESGRFRQESPV
ncbi:MAG: hypothetical protein UV05_C0054G0006 [candidate division CPR1 bacterium GW2011_GWA2_42_17]|uniref:Uncharacterized protein n=1 Tax=candidate division CPR1 bacterium GW2011_GWA2_42_17 TaxID=1618341 RepID=A0A0G1BVM3_9BACT|nr:MAG: hypothetical protein UV05_C0054G0006 [candidate division CPR1 bacterium GW2011_GWA2_42_17]